jgi:hypothetical protein
MFHFTLVHVPGTHHGPDGLSRHRPQPGDEEEPEDDFDDWIDQVNGFIHFINDLPSHKRAFSTSPPMTCFITTTERPEDEDSDDRGAEGLTTDETNEDMPTSYDIVPRSSAAIAADDKMEKVKAWLETLARPDGMTDSEYKVFMRYGTEFFILGDRLWRKDPKKHHKIVIPRDRRLFLVSSAHDDVGHRGFYATNALLSDLGLSALADFVSYARRNKFLFRP